MLIYLRHGDDRARGPVDHRHDRHISDDAKRDAATLADRLIAKYGHPTTVHVSPFRRTLETLAVMTSRFTISVEVRHDPRLAHHFRRKQRERGPDVSPATAGAVMIHESGEDFDRRLDAHVEELHRSGQPRTPQVIWCITHSGVIRRIVPRFGGKKPGDIDFLERFVIKG